MNNAQYTNDEPVIYSEDTGWIIINDWTDIKELDRIAINTLAVARGFTAIDP
jgi:hypothetical protein